MRKNKIKQMWQEGKSATLGWLSISHSFSAEMMARQGFDALCIDMQHGTGELNNVLPMLQAAYGIIVPLINNAEEAAAAVAACRYPPDGIRSSGPVRAMHYGGGNYFDYANDEIIVMAMIETKEGIENLDAICATPGLDAVYIGPADLSYALGLPPKPDNTEPIHLETCNNILESAHKHGIKAVMHCASADFAAGAVERGFDMVMLTSDLHSMIAGAKAQLDTFKAKVG